jgi:uncharacterized UBP type Zn finger protein
LLLYNEKISFSFSSHQPKFKEREDRMKCFNHPAGDAIAICKACGRAFCAECVLESEKGVACQQSCAKVRDPLIKLIISAKE